MGTKYITKHVRRENREDGYDRRTNKNMYEMYKEPKIDMIKVAKRLQQLGHSDYDENVKLRWLGVKRNNNIVEENF